MAATTVAPSKASLRIGVPPYSRKRAPRVILAPGNNPHQVALMKIKLNYCGGGVPAGGAADG
jgi:hypothetical protein